MSMPFKFRGPNAFHFKRKRKRFAESLLSRMAYLRTIHPGGGGGWNGKTGDGVAWRNDMNRFGRWQRVRDIRAGQWAGPWRYERIDDEMRNPYR